MPDSGFILIDKPLGITSFQVVNQLRKITGLKKIGHAGTLDPLATGLLILAIGRPATRQIDQFVKLDKIYSAKIKLGEVSETYDGEGEKTKINAKKITKQQLDLALKKFQGPIEQIPPMYSAKKINGQKLYKLARKGVTIERKPHKITIYKIKVSKFKHPDLQIEVHCSSGTYIRSLAHDLGQELGCGAYLAGLKRTKIGDYSLNKAVKIDKLNKKNWQRFLLPERR